MFKKGPEKVKVMFVDEVNDEQSQVAEYFLNEMYEDKYDVFSAGPKHDFVNCELISVMYQAGYDIRKASSKDFRWKNLPDKLDYAVFLNEATYDRIKDVYPWDCPKIVRDFPGTGSFDATDDFELAQCYTKMIEDIRVWVKDTFKDPESLKSLVV